MPNLDEYLQGQTAIVIGGDDPSGVAKVITEFFKKNEKVDVKAGVLEEKVLTKDEVIALSKLPGLEVLHAQLLGLLAQPATSLVRIIGAVPQNLVNVLQAKVRAESD